MLSTSDSITAQNTYSDQVFINPGAFHFSLTGTWVATVYVQRKDQALIAWDDVDSFTANTQKYGTESVGAYYRFGEKTGGYTSGTAIGKISQEG